MHGKNPIPKINSLTVDEIKKKYFICSRHFLAKDYKNAISRSVNTTAIPSINLDSLDNLHLMRDVTEVTVIESIEVSPQKVVNLNASLKPTTSQTASSVYAIETKPTHSIQKFKITTAPSKTEKDTNSLKASSPVISKIHGKNLVINVVETPKNRFKEAPGKRKISSDVVIEEPLNFTSEKPTPLSQIQPAKKPKMETPQLQELAIPVEEEKPANKLMALFEVTREQYEILSKKLQSGESLDLLNLKPDDPCGEF
jgi:hypothetical protein